MRRLLLTLSIALLVVPWYFRDVLCWSLFENLNFSLPQPSTASRTRFVLLKQRQQRTRHYSIVVLHHIRNVEVVSSILTGGYWSARPSPYFFYVHTKVPALETPLTTVTVLLRRVNNIIRRLSSIYQRSWYSTPNDHMFDSQTDWVTSFDSLKGAVSGDSKLHGSWASFYWKRVSPALRSVRE